MRVAATETVRTPGGSPPDRHGGRRVGPGRRRIVGVAVGAVVIVVAGLLVLASRSDRGGGADDAGASSPPDAGGDATPAVGGTMRIGLAPVADLDPATVSPADASAAIVADLLYDGLTDVVPGATGATPALAASWEDYDGATRWRFVLRPDATFSDGQPVTASDVAYTLERTARLGSASLVATRLEIIAGARELGSGAAPTLAGVVVVDPTTVEIRLTQPFAALPELLAVPALGVVARPSDEAIAAAGVADPRPGVSSGPFRLTAQDADVLTMARAPGRTTLLDGVEVHLSADLAPALEAIDAGELDWSLMAPTRLDEATERFGTDAVTPFQTELFYGFNLAVPAFADPRFRLAMVRAVDREAIANAIYAGTATPLTGIVADGVTGAIGDGCGEPCTHDPAAARALVAEVFGAGPVPEVLIDFADGATEVAVAGAIVADLRAVGIPATLRPIPAAEYGAFAVSGTQQLFRLGWIGAYTSPEAYLSPLFRSASPDNVFGFNDPALDDLLVRAAATTSPVERLALYGEAEARVLAQGIVLPVAQFATLAVAGPAVRDLTLGVDGTFAGDEAWLAPG